MKRMLTIFMSCVILLSLISFNIPVNALSKEVTVNVLSIPLHSNEIGDRATTVYEIDGYYYTTIGQIARLTNFEIKLSGKEHIGGDLHIYDFDDKFDLIGEGYSLLTFVDGIREVTIDLANEVIREGNNHYNVKLALYDNHYIIEAVPILKYLLGNDSCYFEKGVFNCITPQETVWSVLGDAFEDAKTYCYNYTYFFDDYEKRLAIEIAYQCFMDLRIPKIEEYYRKAIHDILSDNIYTYPGVQELSSKQEQEMTAFLSSDDILDITDVSKDVINTSASRITEYTINHQLQTLSKDWLKASNLKESSELSKQINIKTNELIDSKNYYNKTETALKAVMYGANIANAFAKNCAYENDTASLLDSAISPEILSNVDTNSWYWLAEANRINSSIKNKWSNLGNSTLDSTVRLFEDEGNDLIVSSIGEGAASYVLIIKTELLVGKLIYKDTYEMVDRDIMSAFESDMQSAYKNLSHTLFIKARNEEYESIDTIEQTLAAYKFYYKLSAIYLKNVSSQYDEATWMGNYADAAAVMYYRLLTCFKTSNSGFDNLKDDVFSSEELDSILEDSESSDEWKKIYFDVLMNYLNNDRRGFGFPAFDLYDVDDDGVLELFITSDGAHYCDEYIYTMKNGEAVQIDGYYSDYGTWYIKNGCVFSLHFINGGYEDHCLWRKKGTQVISECNYTSNDGAVPESEVEYRINDSIVSKEEYKNKFNEKISGSTSIGRKYDLNSQTISYVLGVSTFHLSEYHDEKEHYLRSAIEERGTLAVWAYADYDGNGEKEAFAITTTEDDEIKAVYFVDSNCNVSVMQTSFDGLSYYESEEGYYRMHAGKGFFWCDYGAHGSGYHTMLYSVKDGTPYALDIASQLQGFYQDGESLYTIEDSFDAGYHQWFKKELVYDSAAQQFRKGRVLGELD